MGESGLGGTWQNGIWHRVRLSHVSETLLGITNLSAHTAWVKISQHSLTTTREAVSSFFSSLCSASTYTDKKTVDLILSKKKPETISCFGRTLQAPNCSMQQMRPKVTIIPFLAFTIHHSSKSLQIIHAVPARYFGAERAILHSSRPAVTNQYTLSRWCSIYQKQLVQLWSLMWTLAANWSGRYKRG